MGWEAAYSISNRLRVLSKAWGKLLYLPLGLEIWRGGLRGYACSLGWCVRLGCSDYWMILGSYYDLTTRRDEGLQEGWMDSNLEVFQAGDGSGSLWLHIEESYSSPTFRYFKWAKVGLVISTQGNLFSRTAWPEWISEKECFESIAG